MNDAIYPYNYASYKSLEDSGQSSFETLYCIKKPADTDGGDFSSVIDLQNSGTEDICKVYVQTLFNYGGRTFWRSPLSTKYFEVKKDSSGNLTYTLVSPVNSISSVSSDFSPYLKNGVSLTAQPLHSTGTYKVTISGYAPEGTDTQNVKYTFKFKKSQTGIYSVSTEETVYLESPADYTLTIEAEAPGGTLYQPCKDFHFDIYLNGSDTPLQDGVLNLTEDLTPPSFTQRSWSPYCSTEAAATFYNMCLPGYFSDGYIDLYTADDGDGDGMYETESGLGLLTYYFIPNSLSSVSECSAFTFEELENSYSAYKKTMTYDLNAKEIKIPYDGLEEGFYTLCEVVKDKNENYAVRCVPAFNKMLGRQIDEKPHKKETLPYYRYFYYEQPGENGNTGKRPRVQMWEDGKWVTQSPSFDKSSTGTSIYVDLKDLLSKRKNSTLGTWVRYSDIYNTQDSTTSGFYDVKIAFNYYDYYTLYTSSDYLENNIVCTTKNVMPGLNGYQIFSKRYALAYTVFCSKKLTQGHTKTDAQVWMNKAQTAGGKEYDDPNVDSFTYNEEDFLGNIPSGAWYCTIFHFPDGDYVMSEIKQR